MGLFRCFYSAFEPNYCCSVPGCIVNVGGGHKFSVATKECSPFNLLNNDDLMTMILRTSATALRELYRGLARL